MFTYAAAAEKLGKRDRKKLTHNTYLRRLDDNTLAVQLHSTDVVVLHSDGTATLNTGGRHGERQA